MNLDVVKKLKLSEVAELIISWAIAPAFQLRQMTKWQRHRQARLTDAQSPASITLEPYMLRLEQLAQVHSDNPEKQAILRALYQYAENL